MKVMAKAAVAELFRAAQQNTQLREQLSKADNIQAFIDMAKEHGYEFTEDEWKSMTQFSVEEFKGELSEIPGI